jgi:outer membrane protein assembly complex protein YaeT
LAAGAPVDYEGKEVAQVRFLPELQPLSAAERNRLVGISPGAPLTSLQVRSAIQRLYATGRYDEISVDAELHEQKVVLTFLTRQNWFITRVTVDGFVEPPNREQLLSSTKLELGSRYSDEQMVEAIKGLHEVLRFNGFYSPRIQPLVERFPEQDELHIVFLIDPGPRAYFARPVITGNLKIEESAIVRATRWMRWWGLFGWRQLSDQRLQQGLDRVRRSYLTHGYLLAKIDLTSAVYDRDENHVRPELRIDAGPKVTVGVSGAKLSRGRIKELVPIYQEQSVDQDLLIEGQRNIAQHFQSQGFFDAQVSFSRRDLSADEQRIEFSIDRGSRYKLVHIGISGNRYFDTMTIRERLGILTAHPLRIRNGRFSEDQLARDRSAIEELYRANGFRDVAVKSRVERNYLGREREVAVFLDVEEGEQWFVNELEISGVDLRLYPYIQSILTSTEGQPYSPFNVATDRDNILNVYYDNGYPDATMEIISTPSERPRTMDLKFIVNEGRRLYVRDVQVNGLISTRMSLVNSRISLEPGAPLSLSSMVFSQRRLYDLGIFAKVDMALENPLGSTREKRILYQMEEASRYSFNSGIGAEVGRIGGSQTSLASPAGGAAFAPRISLGLSRLNAFGLGHTAGVQTRFSTLQRRALFTYLAPQFQGRENLNLTLTALYDDSRNVRTFASRRAEGAFQLGQRFSRALSGQFRFVYRRVSVSDIKIDPKLIPLFSQPVRVGLVSATMINDRRDDPLDATRGQYSSLDVSLANRALASEAAFGRILARNSSYHHVSRDLVLSRNTTFGWIGNYANVDIPLPERFFAGGAVSHRGFPENQAGPRDLVTGFPLGGRALLFNQTELRFPFIGDNVGGVIFHDTGNVYSSFDRISVRLKQRDREDFDYMVHAVGFGVRYRTPIGPIRVDFAYGINSPAFRGYRGSINDLINSRGSPVDQRVNRFQFHFSLGQAF